jgi:two-component sensor histidine kinase
MKPLENKLTVIESLLDKMEKRMASTEEKVDKVDKSAITLAMIVEKLVEKVGLNPSDS